VGLHERDRFLLARDVWGGQSDPRDQLAVGANVDRDA
jgi:hypothetical protein